MSQLEHERNLHGELFLLSSKTPEHADSNWNDRILPAKFHRATVNVATALVLSEWIMALCLFTLCSSVFSSRTAQPAVNAAPHKHNLYISLNVCCNEVKWKWRMATHTQNLVTHMAPGEHLGVRSLAQGSHLSRGIEGGRERWSFTPPTWHSNPQPSGYKYDALTIRPQLPRRVPGSLYFQQLQFSTFSKCVNFTHSLLACH